jgi:hypothetical protein
VLLEHPVLSLLLDLAQVLFFLLEPLQQVMLVGFHLFLVVFAHQPTLFLLSLLGFFLLQGLDSLLLFDLPLPLFGFFLPLVVLFLSLFLLQRTRLDHFLHLFVMQLSLDLHIFCMLLLLVLELDPPLFDFALPLLELFVKLVQSLLVSLSSL